MIPPRFQIEKEEIERVVSSFYAEVRAHSILGPVFAAHVTDWSAHEAKISRFWRNAILFEKIYDGNPMAVHLAAGNVEGPMFEIWLDLFDHILRQELAPQAAEAWSGLAHRIGRGLRFGVEAARAPLGEAPKLS